MTALETQLKASVIWQDLRGQESATLAAIIKAAQQELQNRKAKLRADVADLAKQKKALQRTAAELSGAGIRIRARAQRKDKGSKRGPKLVRSKPMFFCDFEDCDTTVPSSGELCPFHAVDALSPQLMLVPQSTLDRIAELNALDKAADDAECADADARDDYERQNAARGNEP